MFEKIGAFWRVFKAGESVANPTAWKRGQITVAMLVTLGGAVLALLDTFGVHVDMSTDQLASIFGGVLTVVGLFNHAVTVASSDKIGGLGGADPVQPMASDGPGDVAGTANVSADPQASAVARTTPSVQRIDQAAPGSSGADSYADARNSGS